MKTTVSISSHDLMLMAARHAMNAPEHCGKHHADTVMLFLNKGDGKIDAWVEVTLYDSEGEAKSHIFDQQVSELTTGEANGDT